jgi:arylsulfatase A-like enzyme
MKSTVFSTVLLSLSCAFASAAPQPFNILFVLSDDHSAPHMGCYGDPNVATPHFDRFATQAVRFQRAYTTAPQCAPSRKSFLSGRSPVGLQ